MANFVQKENIFLRIVKYLIPWKGDSIGEIIRKIIFLVAAIVLVVSLVLLLTQTTDRIEDNKTNDIISDLYHGNIDTTSDVLSGGSTVLELDTSRQEEIRKENPEVLDEFIPLLEINEDVVGWISVGDADKPFIDYPVVQCEDNDYYLKHDLRGNYSESGAVFADFREPLASADSEPANIILYGHNVASGEYFGMLPRYYNYKPGNTGGLSYYKAYPTFTYSSLYEKYTYKIFAGMMVNTEKSEGDVFYYLRGRNFETKADFDEYIANILDRTTFYTDVDLQYGDHLMTLSTCIVDYGVPARWVLFGRRVREGEDPSVDVEKAYENPDPLYFDFYYKNFSKKDGWDGRKWPAEMIYGYSY